jgi:hypothetical protein
VCEERANAALAAVLLDEGDRDAARGTIGVARSCEAELVLCVALHDEGELRRALDAYSACIERARRERNASIESSALLHRAVACVERGAPGEAYADLRAIVARGETRAVADALVQSIVAATRPTLPIAGALGRLVARAFDRTTGTTAHSPAALVVGARGRWFRTPSAEPVSLERRRPLAQILEVLARARQTRSGAAVSWQELQSAAWPGERMLASAGAHRVRVAVSTLRKLGLRDLLRTEADGYLLDPSCPIARVEDE